MAFAEIRTAIQTELDNINDLRQSGRAPYSIPGRVQKILDYLVQLRGLTTDENYIRNLSMAIDAVFHTKEKEVLYVDSAYQKTLKAKAPKIRKREYESELSNLVTQLDLDLFSVLKTDPTDYLPDAE